MLAGIKRSGGAGPRHCASGLVAAGVWTAWLLLVLLLAFQGYIASVRELEVPRFLLHAIEDHLAQSGVSVAFGRAIFDPSGRVLIERARFKLASFSEPVVTARAIYIRLDPLALVAGRCEPSEIRAAGADLFIPAMLSRSGASERIVQDLDAGFSITSRGDEFSVDYLNCRLGGGCVSAHGAVNAGTAARRSRRLPPPRRVRVKDLRRPQPGVLARRGASVGTGPRRAHGRARPVRGPRRDRERRAARAGP